MNANAGRTAVLSFLALGALALLLAFASGPAGDLLARNATGPVLATVDVNIADSGLDPAVITVTVGSQVVWHNSTAVSHTLAAGQPYRVYLPVAVRAYTGSANQAQTVGRESPVAPSTASLGGTLAPGGVYTYTFASAGSFPYYLSTLPRADGRVVVQESPATATATATATTTATATSTPTATPGGLPADPETQASAVDQSQSTVVGEVTSFLYTGSNPIQTGVVSGTIVITRAAVLRGQVLTADSQPLTGTVMTVVDHPEFGQTLSRADGMFDLAVNGGGSLTVSYAKNGYLPARRQVTVPWQDYTWLPDVVLTSRDVNVTTVDLTSSSPVQVARGSVISDADGLRQATVLFPQGTGAVITLTSGATQTLTSLNVRATEYTVGDNGPKAMPAQLPPNSAYTYAVELGVDEAEAAGAIGLRFSQPLPVYVENFLSFPVGITVPVGYFDRSRNAWVPSDNGRVIGILTPTLGLAEIDVDGSGTAAISATLAALGITDAERQRLAALYGPGQSLWRWAVRHFSAWDANWGWGPPADAQPPTNDPPRPVDKGHQCDCERGSLVEVQNQILGETLELVGTPFDLNYRSDRVEGYDAAYWLDIPLSGGSVPASLVRIDLEVAIAGRLFRQNYASAPNQTATFVWDGLDAYGRAVQARQTATVRVGYVYRGVYQRVERFGYNGNGTPISGSRTRREVTLWQGFYVNVGTVQSLGQGLGGWTPDIQHAYDPLDHVLYLGDGSRRGVGVTAFVVSRFSLGGFTLGRAVGIAPGADGSLYAADDQYHRVVRISASGIVTGFASGYNPYGCGQNVGDGGPAHNACLYYPYDVASGPDGSLYIADSGNVRIRRVDASGIITTVARVSTSRLAVAQDGSLYFDVWGSSYYSKLVRRLGPDGIIRTVAGTGAYGGPLGDGGPATEAYLSAGIGGLAIGPDGSLYISDRDQHRVRRVTPDGIINTVAGTGSYGFSGDGGPATEARLSSPQSIAVAPDGRLFIRDGGNKRIRVVATNGIITTLAGNGSASYSEGVPPATTGVGDYGGLAMGPDGSLYFAQGDRIRRIFPPLPGFSAGDLLVPSEDGTLVYRFNPAGRHLQTLSALTRAVVHEFGYDSAGRLVQIQDGDGNTTTVEHDGSGNPTAIVGPYGHRTTLTVDANGYLASVANPAGETTRLAYAEGGLLTSLTDPKGNTHSYSYDSRGRLARDASPAASGSLQTLSRTEITAGYEVTRTTALSRTTAYRVTTSSSGVQTGRNTLPDGAQSQKQTVPNGTTVALSPEGVRSSRVEGPDPRFGMMAPLDSSRLITTPLGLAMSASVARTATLTNAANLLSLSRLSETVTINGRAFHSAFLAPSLTFTATSPLGRQVTTTVDSQVRPTGYAVPGLDPLSFAYDARGRLISASAGSGAEARAVTYTYGVSGYLASVADPLGRTESYGRDLAGRVVTQTLSDGRATGYAYDANGNVVAVTPPGRPAHTFGYDSLDQTAVYTAPTVGGLTTTRYTYDADRMLTRIDRPDGSTVDLAYDAAGRLVTVTHPLGAIGVGYGITGSLPLTIAAPGGITLANSFDGALLTRQALTGPVSGTVNFGYDSFFRVASLGVGASGLVSLTYDADGLLVRSGDLSLGRDARNGLVVSTTLAAVTDTYGYSGFGELTSHRAITTTGGAALYDARYARDRLGRVSRLTETVGLTTAVYTYAYDLAGRLITATMDGAVVGAYTYDANGNRLTYAGQFPAVAAATYDDQDRLLAYGAAVYTYTASGELRRKVAGSQTTAYEYDALGNTVAVTLPNGTTIGYLADGQNRRIGKRVNGTLTEGFLYQSGLQPIAELDATGQIVSLFVYGSRANVPDYLVKEETTYRIVADHLGSPRLVVNAQTGAVAQRLDYDEFGRVLSDTNPGFQPFGYAGGLYDPDTGLVRFGARDYDAETGRWTAKDPIGFAGGDTNLYAYVRNDPINRVDPSGLDLRLVRMSPLAQMTQLAQSPLMQMNMLAQSPSAKLTDAQAMGLQLFNNEGVLTNVPCKADGKDPKKRGFIRSVGEAPDFSQMMEGQNSLEVGSLPFQIGEMHEAIGQVTRIQAAMESRQMAIPLTIKD
ncbi:MAG: hypothetical protein HYX94_05510 [Chloroflexi bacterium]|nr:hypothetical protein [Chloroflexota bacterium]